ncbi:MAG: flippase-like domain-containing protein [Calditrichaeota bacterium]|nr:flippase-like domain-containing protein [Calditrichota bacterium]
MARKIKQSLRLFVGLAISVFFLYLAIKGVDLHQVGQALLQADYWWFVPALAALFGSHWLRAVRHKLLLDPVHRFRSGQLFSALMIGYMANDVLPAHLGEVLRAYIIGKKGRLPASLALATIAVERVIDVLTLIVIMGITFVIFPFPSWVRTSGYLTFGFALALIVFLVALRKYESTVTRWVQRLLGPISQKLAGKIATLIREFARGVVPLRRRLDYLWLVVLSVLIWAGYVLVFVFGFQAFDLSRTYNLPWDAALVTLVITTIAVVVPSSPGYVGTYHWLCMKSLELFGIPASASLSFAVAVHAISFLPVALVGFIFAGKEGYSLSKISHTEETLQEPEVQLQTSS